MQSRGKSGGEGAEKEENLGEKLKRRSKRGGAGGPPCTPVRILHFARASIITLDKPSSPLPYSAATGPISARNLAAALWEFHHYVFRPKMHRTTLTNGPPRLRRLKDKQPAADDGGAGSDGMEISRFMADPCPSSPEQPASASSLRRHVTSSLMQHYRSIERISRAIQPASPVSYASSMEVTPYNPAVTPSSSIDYKGRGKEPHYSLKTSTELLKVLNRIWSLEEQHASNISLIRGLKTELDHARARTKELLRAQATDRKEIDALMKQITEDRLIRKSKEQEKIQELDDERKLRKRSESLHRKLAREIADAKSSLSNALKELEDEIKSRKLLEDLCDEFAIGIRDYEQELHDLKKKSEEWAGGNEQSRVILHVAESWLDERVQMKMGESEMGSKGSVVEKLRFELETFLQAKRKGALKRIETIFPKERWNSLESNEEASGPRDLAGEEDSDDSDSNCFELKRRNNDDVKADEAKTEADVTKTKVVSRRRRKPRTGSNVQVKFQEHMARAMAGPGKEELEDIIKDHLAMSGGGGGCMHPELECGEPSWRTQASPVQQWMARLASPDLDIAESASKWQPKEGSLKAKLMEARLKGQRVRSKPVKGGGS